MSVPGNFEVRDAKVEKLLNNLGQTLRSVMPPGLGFSLLIFPFNRTDGGMFYTSNAQRQDICNAMREFIAKFEGN